MHRSQTIHPVLAFFGVVLALWAVLTGTAAAAVVSSVHYQAQMNLNCVNSNCSGNFPALADKHRLNLTRVNCFLAGSPGTEYNYGEVSLRTATNVLRLQQYLPQHHSST